MSFECPTIQIENNCVSIVNPSDPYSLAGDLGKLLDCEPRIKISMEKLGLEIIFKKPVSIHALYIAISIIYAQTELELELF